jgi:hypothetical protein
VEKVKGGREDIGGRWRENEGGKEGGRGKWK